MIRSRVAGLLVMATAVFSTGLEAQANSQVDCAPGSGTPTGQVPAPRDGLQDFDVVVDVPDLCVESLRLNVEDLDARLSLNARVANLVTVNAGADVYIGRVDLGIEGVRAKALLVIDLDNVVQIVDETLTFIDNNPEVLSQLVGTVQQTVGTVGRVTNTALQPGGVVDQTLGTVNQTVGNLTQPGGVLSETLNAAGQTVQTTLDTGGSLVQRTLDSAGSVVQSQNLGRLLDLPVVSETVNSSGQTVRQVRDTAGNLVEFTVDNAGNLLNARSLGSGGRQ